MGSEKSQGCTRSQDCPAQFHWSGCKSNPKALLYTKSQVDEAIKVERERVVRKARKIVKGCSSISYAMWDKPALLRVIDDRLAAIRNQKDQA